MEVHNGVEGKEGVLVPSRLVSSDEVAVCLVAMGRVCLKITPRANLL